MCSLFFHVFIGFREETVRVQNYMLQRPEVNWIPNRKCSACYFPETE